MFIIGETGVLSHGGGRIGSELLPAYFSRASALDRRSGFPLNGSMQPAEPRRFVGLSMLGRLLDFLLADILLLLLLPVLALGFLLKKLIVIRRMWIGSPVEPERHVPAPVRRLVFARAIEAYEELIDVTAHGTNRRTPRSLALVRQA